MNHDAIFNAEMFFSIPNSDPVLEQAFSKIRSTETRP